MKKVRIGMIGAGFISRIHLEAFRRVYGLQASVEAVCARSPSTKDFAAEFGIPRVYSDYKELLKDPDIDVVDICTPPQLHSTMVEESIMAGKHVICEKPFTGYFGMPGDVHPVGKVCKQKMYDSVMETMEKTAEIVRKSGLIFCYAEDWVYAPAVTKAAEILKKTKDKVLFFKADESHSGSHAWHAAEWAHTGGGSMIRQGCHPLSAVLYLKMVEAEARGEKFSVESVMCDTGVVTENLTKEERRFITANPVDVEDWSVLSLTFGDKTKAAIFSGDFVTGGVRNLIEFNTNTGTIACNIAPNTNMMTYTADASILKDIYVTEKVETTAGWQYVLLDEESARGYIQEAQDFMECIAEGREPLAGLDLAYETTKLTYAGYLSAEKGARIKV
ncbi:MAG: Gfo/Idh/MocA family oxidoreductase [Synergistaceae bacterium]|nr:Gfo/Idh/MocA family oxidoreductase [Synergistaceae bacterium]